MVDRRIKPNTRAVNAVRRVMRRRMLTSVIVSVFAGGTFCASVDADMPVQIPSSKVASPSSGTIQANPFLAPKVPSASRTTLEMSAVRLASGGEARSPQALQLKPIGIAVGLHSIDDGALPRPVRPALTVNRPQPSAIQTNRHLGSLHHGSRDLQDTVVAPSVPRRSVGTAQGVDTQNSDDAYFRQPATFVRPNSTVAAPQQPIAQTAGEVVEPAAPITFSLSDDSQDSSIPNASSEANADVAPAVPSPELEVPSKVSKPTAPVAEALEISFGDEGDDSMATTEKQSQPSVREAEPTLPTNGSPAKNEPPVAAVNAGNGIVTVAEAYRFDAEPEMSIETADPIALQDAPVIADGDVTEDAVASNQSSLPVVERSAAKDDRGEASDDAQVAQDDVGFADLVAPVVLGGPAGSDASVDDAKEVVPSATRESASGKIVFRGSDEDPAAKWRPPVAVAAPPATFHPASMKTDKGIVRSAIDPTTTTAETQQVKEQTLHWKPTGVASSLPQPVRSQSKDAIPAETEAASKPNATKPALATVSSTPLYMTRAQVRSLTIRGQLHKVSVGDRNVCQAVAAGTSQIKLIGVGHGVTELVVWASVNQDERVISRAFQIHVTDSVEASSDPASEKMSVLSQSIRHAFPNSDVTIQLLTDKLVVSGRCPSEDSAKKVIRMVRKTCLVPVIDELIVR